MRLMFRQYNEIKDVNKNINRWVKQGEWYYISLQKLSEKFIEKYKDKVD
jgi:hypothetical protein